MGGLDSIWEAAKRRWPQMAGWDRIDDQTHLHHTVVSVLVFGALGTLVLCLMHGTSPETANFGLAVGIVGGWAFYLGREFWNRLSLRRLTLDRRWKPWDGFMDVFVPVALTLPWVAATLLGSTLPWTGLALYLGYALMAFMYTVGRPRG